MHFTKTTKGGTADSYFTLKLENDRYTVKIFYHDFDFAKLRSKHKLDFNDISVSVKYKHDPLPFDILIDPADIDRCRLDLTEPGIRYGQLDSLQDDIHEAKNLIQSIMTEIQREFRC